MRAFATQDDSYLAYARSRDAGRPFSLPAPAAAADGPSLQRKSSCACGGGCPRCAGSPPAQTHGGAHAHEARQEGERQSAADFPDGLGSGRPLDSATRGFFETRFGHDFGRVRLHTDARAAESAQAVGALAFTLGPHIAFASGQYAPDTFGGRFLLAHELAHTIQSGAAAGPGGLPPVLRPVATRDEPAEGEATQSALSIASGGTAGPIKARTSAGVIHRFEAWERFQIGSLEALIAATSVLAHQHVSASRAGVFLDWAGFVIATGGRASVPVGPLSAGQLIRPRYIFTCRCGLIDMRHFFQLAYIAHTFWNRRATEMGRNHELRAEVTSRFAPEDTPSNAMGAFFGSRTMGVSPGAFVTALSDYLRICNPVDFNALTPADQTTIVDFYSARDASGVPANRSELATPVTLTVTACGATPDRSFPFVVDSGDLDRKTITSLIAPYSLTGDAEIRDWVFAQNNRTLGGIPASEKIRLINRLLGGWVSEGDIGAVERLCASVSSASEMSAIRTAIGPREAELLNEGQRNRLHQALNRTP